MVNPWLNRPRTWVMCGVMAVMLVILACGTAAPPEQGADTPSTSNNATNNTTDSGSQPAKPPQMADPTATKEVSKSIIENVKVTATPIPQQPQETTKAKVDRVIYGFGEVTETNRHWTVSRPSYYQFDPWAETLLDLEPTSNDRIPRLAKDWDMSADAKDWTFYLEEGVQFHDGWGELTADDVKFSAELHLRDDAGGATPGYFGPLLDSIEVVDDHTITFHLKGSSLIMPDKVSRGFGGGEIMILSKNQIDTEGLEGLDKKPAGTGLYEYGGRKVGESIWFVQQEEPHWRGETGDFKEIEIRWMREEATRLAALLSGEIHIASLSRENQFQAIQQGMKNIAGQVPTNYLVLFFGGLYFSDGDPAYDPNVPWAHPVNGPLIRQAMNKAIDRQEMQDFVLRGSGSLMYNTAFHPALEGWNPKWVEDWEEHYGYDPDAARELMSRAGYGPNNPMDFTIYNYVSSDEPETAVMVEALINYWEPIGVNVSIIDSEWGTVRSNYRAKNDVIKKGGWGNVITMRSMVERLTSWAYPDGTSRNWETNLINQNIAKINNTVDTELIDQLVREVGDERYYSYPDVPFFWFDLEVTVNPDIIESWTYPGTAGSKTSHWNLLKAAK